MPGFVSCGGSHHVLSILDLKSGTPRIVNAFDDARPLEDWEYPDPDSEDIDDEPLDTIICPECGRAVWEEADCCACGYFLTDADRRGKSSRAFGPLVGTLILLAVIGALMSLVFLSG